MVAASAGTIKRLPPLVSMGDGPLAGMEFGSERPVCWFALPTLPRTECALGRMVFRCATPMTTPASAEESVGRCIGIELGIGV